MTKYEGADIFLIDSPSGAARFVKFLMQSPTIWHWIIGKILRARTGKVQILPFIDEVKYYHAGMFFDHITIIEQQEKVEVNYASRILGKPRIVLRKLSLTEKDKDEIVKLAVRDIGKGYDILLIFGKTLAWLTGIRFLMRLAQWPGKEICVSRVAYWYDAFETFGRRNWHEVTTDDIEDWARAHPKDWLIVEEAIR